MDLDTLTPPREDSCLQLNKQSPLLENWNPLQMGSIGIPKAELSCVRPPLGYYLLPGKPEASDACPPSWEGSGSPHFEQDPA